MYLSKKVSARSFSVAYRSLLPNNQCHNFCHTISWYSSLLNACINPHLTLVMLLHYPRTHLQPNRHVVFHWMHTVALKRSWMMRPHDDRQIPVFLEISSTDWCVWCAILIEHVITNKITYSAICTVFLLEIGKKDLYLCNTRGYNRTKLQANMANCKQYLNHSVQKWPRKSRRGLWNPRSLRCLTTQKYSVHFARSNRNANWT